MGKYWAGAVVIAALTLALLALGAGLGLSSVSPWSDSGVSASTFNNIAGAYLLMAAILSSAIGGFLAARLRTKWTGLHTHEVFFRDTAHGFVAWAFATVLSASALGAAATYIVSGTAAGLGQAGGAAAQNINPSRIYVDRLFRTEGGASATSPTSTPAGTAGGGNDAARSEVARLWTQSFRENNEPAPADRTYIARLVSAQTGIAQPEAERRVTDVIAQTKEAIDRARRGATKLAFWMTAALVFGAFAASLAAVEGGQLRDGTWTDRGITKRPW